MRVADYYAFTANNFAMFGKEVNVYGGGNCLQPATSSSTQTLGLNGKPFMLGAASCHTAALATRQLSWPLSSIETIF
jgi:hypothetical protein